MKDLERHLRVREVSDFSCLALNRYSIPKDLIEQCDMNRMFDVYPRKSQKNDKTNYLEVQESLPGLLRDAGVLEILIYTYQGRDHNISGTLGPEERADMAELKERLLSGIVGTVCMAEIARLHRDWTAVDPADFAAIMDLQEVRVLARIGGEWTLLDMTNPTHNRMYREEAQKGADELVSIVGRLCPSRVNAITKKGGHGNGPAPFGLIHVPRQNRYQSGTGEAMPAHREKYPLHIAIKKQIMCLSLQPHIMSYPALQYACFENEIYIVPFDPESRAIAHPASMLAHVGEIVMENGKRIKKIMPPDFEPFVPKVTMLRNILLDTWVTGDVRYGSGKQGAYQIRALAEKSKRGNRNHLKFKLIQPARPAIRKDDPYLSVAEDDPELLDLFWQVVQKWSPINIQEARENDYKYVYGEEPKNAAQTAGKPVMIRPRGSKYTNWWAARVHCLKHGWEGGEPRRTHFMRINPDGVWSCDADHNKDKRCPRCTSYSAEHQLRSVLDSHFLLTIRVVLESGGPLLGTLQEEQRRLLDQRRLLNTNLTAIATTIEDQERFLSKLYVGWERADGEEFADGEMEKWREKHLMPLYTQRSTILRDLGEITKKLGDQETPPPPCTEEQIRKRLMYAMDNWEGLSVARRRQLIFTLVDWVGIICPPGYDRRETLIFVRWANGMTNVLIGWRALTMDYRAWEPWEDEALRRLWPSSSGANINQIRAALLPGRKMSNMERRTRELGISQAADRSVAWRRACKEAEKPFGEQNPDILYLLLPLSAKNVIDARNCLAVKGDGTEEYMPVHEETAVGVRMLLEEYAPGEYDLLTEDRSHPPAGTCPEPDTSSRSGGDISTHTCRTASASG
jgi:hypothetical protein